MKVAQARISIVTDQAPDSGVGAYAAALYRLLRPAIPGLRLVDAHYFPHLAYPEATAVDGIRTTERFWEAPGTVRRNYSLLADESSEVDLWHLTGTHYGLAGGPVPTVATIHDLYVRRPGVGDVTDVRRLAIEGYSALHTLEVGRQLRRTTARVSISRTTHDQLMRQTRLDSEVIYHWTDLPRFRRVDRRGAREGLGLAMEGSLLLNVGSGSLNKNRRVLNDIADRLPAGMKILKVGAPSVAPHPRIINLGLIHPELYPLVFSACDAYVHTSTFEGFGRPLLEAMAAGLPVVSTDAPATPEVLGEAAEYVRPPYDAEQFVAQIHRALSNGRAEELRRLGESRARRFAPEPALRAYLELYERALSRS